MTGKNLIVKTSLAAMLLNLYVFTVVFKTTIPHSTQITTVISIAFIVIFSLSDGRKINKAFVGLYPSVLYSIFLFISGAILSLYTDYDITKSFGYFEMILFGIIICYICWSDQSYEFLYILCITIAAIDAVYALITTQNLYSRVVLANNVSENTAGLLFFAGVISTYLTKNKNINSYVKLILNIIYVFAMVLTGSRQALLLSGIVYMCWFFPYFKRRLSNKIRISDIVFLCVIVALIIIFFKSSLIEDFQNTKLYARLIGANTSTTISDARRGNLYSIGLETMLSSPIWGTGYQNNVYTHSTYMEVLAGSGLVGALIFYIPIIKRTTQLIRNRRRSLTIMEKEYYNGKLLVMITLLVMMAFRAVHYYMPSFMLLIIGLTSFDYQHSIKEQ